ncbi:hypothetical protein L1987_00748 [Smallanthus sonchifolius]|uniref:Uncharacterized protein n=1 Tax=Smallanthus sonchifolius TaxID=185202 RepID=A0ACB9K302_9ASTR|nr:hypothetical protein L1987_00748 [Smallanthus sonchifolius]
MEPIGVYLQLARRHSLCQLIRHPPRLPGAKLVGEIPSNTIGTPSSTTESHPIVDDGGDARLLIHEGVKVEEDLSIIKERQRAIRFCEGWPPSISEDGTLLTGSSLLDDTLESLPEVEDLFIKFAKD